MSDNTRPQQDERVKQLVEFLDQIVDDSFKSRFTELSTFSKEDLKLHTQKLEDYALKLGLAEQNQLLFGRLLCILPEDGKSIGNSNDNNSNNNNNQ